MAFTDAEKVSIRRHLGYNSAAEANYPWIDTFRALSQVLDSAPAETETEARTILGHLADIESRLTGEALLSLKATQVGSIGLNNRHPQMLGAELARWRCELSKLLGVPLLDGDSGGGWGSSGAVKVV
jgi:hypothetical protein